MHPAGERRDPDYLRDHVVVLPNAVTEAGFAWHLLTGVDGQQGIDALATQHVSVNIDPSDRYVQSVPAPTGTGCGPTRAATTTWCSPATGPIPA